jgi:hypothetical protein
VQAAFFRRVSGGFRTCESLTIVCHDGQDVDACAEARDKALTCLDRLKSGMLNLAEFSRFVRAPRRTLTRGTDGAVTVRWRSMRDSCASSKLSTQIRTVTQLLDQ